MSGRSIIRVGLALPFSAQGQVGAEADALRKAAELALFSFGGQFLILIPADTGTSPQSTEAAAKRLIDNGVDAIIGPLQRDQVGAIGPMARAAGVPVMAFSNDRTVGGNGVYLLSFQPADEARALLDHAANNGIRDLVLVSAGGEYAERLSAAVSAEAPRRGSAVASPLWLPADASAQGPVLAGLVSQLKAAKAQGRRQAVIIPEPARRIRALAPTLQAAGLTPQLVNMYGTSLWTDEDAARLPALSGALFTAADPAARADFDARFRQAYGTAPTRLASLAYDAVALAAVVGQERGMAGFTRARIEDPNGFYGADGLLRFNSDGTVERGLAILEANPQAQKTQSPGAKTFFPPVG